MKKLMILVAAIALAFASQAASFKWSAVNLYAANGSDKFVGTVTLYAVIDGVDTVVSTVTSSETGKVAATTFSSDDLLAGTYYDFFFTYEDANKSFTSTTKNVLAQSTSTANITFGNMTTATQDPGNWQSIPEPTSGLLLLLGMAGLALKRKRA